MKSIEEKRLLYRVTVEGSAEAFAGLYDLYADPIYRFVFLKVSHAEAAEDITSEVFFKTWRYLTSANKKGKRPTVQSFSGLVYQIARNAVVDYYRERAKDQEERHDIIIETKKEDAMEAQSDIDRMYHALRQLKQEYQEVLLLRYIEERSFREIAKILGRSEVSARVTVYRAIRLLKRMLENTL